MADGNIAAHGRVIGRSEAGSMVLADAASAGHVVARCPTCGHRESADIDWWMRSSFDRRLSLATLEQRLRCLCGGRQVTLEVWPLSFGDSEERRRTFIWRG